jgi:hypothetical protein
MRNYILQEPHISQDQHYISMAFHTPDYPAKGATRIHIKGNVTLVVAKDQKEIEKKDVALGRVVDLQVGTLKSANSGSGRDNLLFYNSDTRPLKKLVVLDDKGNEIPYRHVSSYNRAFAAKGDGGFQTSLHASPAKRLVLDRCTLRVTYFETVERIIVPIDIQVGLGF